MPRPKSTILREKSTKPWLKLQQERPQNSRHETGERRERGEKKVQVTVGGSHGSRETGYLPPLAQSRHQGTGRERSGSKDAGGGSHYGRVGGV